MLRALIACFFCAGLLSCGSSRIASEQLILFFDPPTVNLDKERPPDRSYPFKVKVKDLDLGRLYDNASIIMRNGDNTVQFSKKGLWAVRPNVSASDLLQETLKQNIKFRVLKSRFTDSSPDYVISGSMDNIEEDLRKPEERCAGLNITLQIVRNADDQVLFERRYGRSATIAEAEGYGILAKELSLSLSEIYKLFITDAVHVFNKELETYNAKNDGKDQ